MYPESYNQAVALLHRVSTPYGFLASAAQTTNYHRVWARDGVICGLSALASGDAVLIETFAHTLETLANHQHKVGTIPSNVMVGDNHTEVSYGGLAGRVDAVTWFIIGVCQYAYHQNDLAIIGRYQTQIEKAMSLLDAWEFNNKDLVYVPLSGNWADEYITDGYVLYDQLLRIWALRSYNHFIQSEDLTLKIQRITQQVTLNFCGVGKGDKFHERAYEAMGQSLYYPCSFSPSGYKTQYDAFANSLAILLGIGTEEQRANIISYSKALVAKCTLGLVPAFWPPIFEQDEQWSLLKNNCKYEFRNSPYEFHNGGSWAMVNGFYGLALQAQFETDAAQNILEQIHETNARDGYSFYENFNTKTSAPNGVAYCAWSAAAGILLQQSLTTNFKIVF